MDVRVRDKKNKNVIKTIPLKTYELLRHKYVRIDENGEAITSQTVQPLKKNEVKKDVILAEVETPEPETETEVPTPANDSTESIDDLRAQYELLSSSKPDKRWGANKLKNEIENLKTNG